MVRTIEQILGARPLNQKLAAATPMYNAFRSTPDLSKFTTVPNQIPLTEGVATPPACGPDTLGLHGAAVKSLGAQEAKRLAVPSSAKPIVKKWQQWRAKQHFTGASAVPDYAAPAQMNRYTWYQGHNWKVPYPGEAKVYARRRTRWVPAVAGLGWLEATGVPGLGLWARSASRPSSGAAECATVDHEIAADHRGRQR